MGRSSNSPSPESLSITTLPRRAVHVNGPNGLLMESWLGAVAHCGYSTSQQTSPLYLASISRTLEAGRKKSWQKMSKRSVHTSHASVVTSDEKYCSQLCKEAGADEVEIACDCGHPACAE